MPSLRVEHALAVQIELRAAIPRPLEELAPVHLSLGLAAAPVALQGRPHGLQITSETDDKAAALRDAALLGGGQPGGNAVGSR